MRHCSSFWYLYDYLAPHGTPKEKFLKGQYPSNNILQLGNMGDKGLVNLPRQKKSRPRLNLGCKISHISVCGSAFH